MIQRFQQLGAVSVRRGVLQNIRLISERYNQNLQQLSDALSVPIHRRNGGVTTSPG